MAYRAGGDCEACVNCRKISDYEISEIAQTWHAMERKFSGVTPGCRPRALSVAFAKPSTILAQAKRLLAMRKAACALVRSLRTVYALAEFIGGPL